MLIKTLAITVAAGALSALVAADAGALTLAPVKPTVQNDVTQVADGCGRGRRYSRRLGRCVVIGAPLVVPPVVVPPVVGCGPGRRWSPRLRRCVFI